MNLRALTLAGVCLLAVAFPSTGAVCLVIMWVLGTL